MSNFNLTKPYPGWRKGQTIFNFLQWLVTEKGFEPVQSNRVADPFYLNDDKFDRLYDEFLESTGRA